MNPTLPLALYAITALAEILGCWLVWRWVVRGDSPWLLVPAALALALFAWLLTLHPAATGRVYAAYGGVYVAMAIGWLWLADGVRPSAWDWAGTALVLVGSAVIVFGGWQHA